MIKASSPTKLPNDKKFHLEFFLDIVARKLGKKAIASKQVPEREERAQ